MGQDPAGGARSPRGARTRPTRISPITYWRRRVLVFTVGIGLLTALSWTVNGVLAARSSADHAASPGDARGAGSATAHASRGRALPASSPSPRPKPASSPHRSTAHSPAAGTALACAPEAVTLRLSSPQYWYQAGKIPRFTVHAVSSEGQPCRFNMGTRFVSVVVASDQRVWSSADCVSGGGSNMVVLTRGVPAVLSVSWDRKTSSPGCGGTSHAVAPGEYSVTAVAGQLRSKTVNLVLGAPGASGP
jgi:hypothetical protein